MKIIPAIHRFQLIVLSGLPNRRKNYYTLGIGKTGRGAGAGAGDFLVKPGPGDTASNCYFCTKDGLLMQKRTVTKYLVRVHKRSGRTKYIRHKWSGRTIYDDINGPTRT